MQPFLEAGAVFLDSFIGEESNVLDGKIRPFFEIGNGGVLLHLTPLPKFSP